MTLPCTRCDGTGFLNSEQVDDYSADSHEAIIEWIRDHENHDVTICDCCGNDQGWYGSPGQHYTSDDPRGDKGPYAGNGGLCRCN